MLAKMQAGLLLDGALQEAMIAQLDIVCLMAG
jgi:hypothetical protein